MENCQHCVRQIGEHERTFRAGAYVVCEDCYTNLVESGALVGADYVEDPLESIATAAALAPRRRSANRKTVPSSHFIICPNPNCGFRGGGTKKRKASTGISLLLILLWLGFGLLYGFELLCGFDHHPAAWVASVAAFLAWLGNTIFGHGKYLLCPRCGVRARDA